MNDERHHLPNRPRPIHPDRRPGPVQRVIERLLTWQRRANERRHLMQIDDRLLADMGITRADAEHEYRKPFWR